MLKRGIAEVDGNSSMGVGLRRPDSGNGAGVARGSISRIHREASASRETGPGREELKTASVVPTRLKS